LKDEVMLTDYLDLLVADHLGEVSKGDELVGKHLCANQAGHVVSVFNLNAHDCRQRPKYK